MRVWEKDGCWIEETYVFAMHTPEGTKYPFEMLRQFMKIARSKTEGMVMIPTNRDDIFNLFSKHFKLEPVNRDIGLYLVKHKE